MSSSLAGVWAKIERARELVECLDREISRLLEGDRYKVIGENQPERQRYAFKLLGPRVPDKIAVSAGEIIHHLRCCFDHVIWALAAQNGLSPDARITFPVCITPEQFRKAVKNGIIKGVSESHRPVIEAIQPYRTDDATNSLLRAIHDLDIADKHRLLVVVTHTLVLGNTLTITKNDASPSSGFGIELPSISAGGYPWAIEDGFEVHWVPLRGGPNPGFEMTTNSSIQISFECVGTVERPPLLQTLVHFCNYTEREIRGLSAALGLA
jgi:hypothetical protein